MFHENVSRKPHLRWLFLLLSLVVPLLVVYDVYDQYHTPTLDFLLVDHDPTASVVQVFAGGEAYKAGLRVGDIIHTIDGAPVAVWANPKLGQTHILEVERDNQWLLLHVPVVSAAKSNRIPLIGATVVVFAFWGASMLLLRRRYNQASVQVFFLMCQTIAIAMWPILAHPHFFFLSRWMVTLSIVCFHLLAPLALHHTLTFPALRGSSRQRRWGLSILYGLAVAAIITGLSSNSSGWLVSAYYSSFVAFLAVIVLIYVYLRQSTPDNRRRLRLIVVGNTLASVPALFFYFLPMITNTPPQMPEWLVGIGLIVAPLSYLFATARYNLFGIDHLLNRALVYLLLSSGIFLLYLGPFLLLYRYLPGDVLAQTFVVAGLTLLTGVGFNWTRTRVQKGVDILFYGGWYDYPGVVEIVSDALARSIERSQLTKVLTCQVSSLMQLHEGELVIDASDAQLSSAVSSQLQFPLAFQGQIKGIWVVQPRRDGEDFTHADWRILKTIARQAEVALGNVLLVETLRLQLSEIRASRKTLAQTQHQLLRSREEERARLARDLHDGPIQTLVGLNLQLGLMMMPAAISSDTLMESPMAEGVQDMRTEVKNLLTELRQICTELRPPMLDTLGLGSALRALAKEWSIQNQVDVILDLPSDAQLRSLPGEVTVNLFRVVQEALSNVAHHAYARQVTLVLICEANSLTLTVCDDGQGFVPPTKAYDLTVQGHFGLVGMQERMALIGGMLTIDSAPGRGTAVNVVWPAPA